MKIFIIAISLCFGSTHVFALQEFDSTENLEGVWQLDYPKTRKLWTTPELKEMAEQISMIPIASPTIVFSKSDISFELVQSKSKYQIQSFEKGAKLLTLKTEINGRKSILQFVVPDSNTLVLDMPASIFGPIQVAYTRKKLQKDSSNTDSPFKEIAGDWILDEAATKKWWEKIADSRCLTNYVPIGERAIKDARKINISDAEIGYIDGTFAPWQILQAEKNGLLLGSFGRPVFEIRIISNQILQLADRNRSLLAIYKRKKSTPIALDIFPDNRMAQGIIDGFRPIESRPAFNGNHGVIAKSGSVEIDEISITRRRASYSAKGADIVYMELEFFVGLPEKHYGVESKRLIKLNRLDDIYDDQGALLLNEDRRNSIQFLKHPIMSRQSMTRRSGINGPGFSIKLEAPSIGASKLKKIAGEIELTRVTEKMIRFSDVRNDQKDELSHPLLEGHKIQARVKRGREFILSGSNESLALIADWYLVDASGKRLNPRSFGRNAGQSQGFSDSIPQNVDLVLNIHAKEKTEVYPFTFDDIAIQEPNSQSDEK